MLRITHGDIHLIDLKTRLPFKYGIATMTSAPHAFVRIEIELDGKRSTGIAADHLPPKWFTKVPEKPLDVEIDEMLRVIEHAVGISAGLEGKNAFDVWRQLYDAQYGWGRDEKYPPLLSNFGTTLVERAMIEAACKAMGKPFAEMVRSNALGMKLGELDQRLEGMQPAELLPAEPRCRCMARHTIGMADFLTEAEIPADERLNDGLPQSLAACIGEYGLRHFKVKVSGELATDIDRVSRIAEVIEAGTSSNFAFSMDGNEQFRSLDAFRSYWKKMSCDKRMRSFFGHLLYVEQPFHRDIALDTGVLGEMRNWADRPTMIIDESDAELDSLQRALELGYHGTSHKNCKGVFHGIAAACLLEKLQREQPESNYVMSGEDLANIGPVALLQDLAVVATLGVTSVERNGHHYFAGLSAFSKSIQQQILTVHGDLYHAGTADWPTLTIRNGELTLDSINSAMFGVGFELDIEQFQPSDEWRQTTAANSIKN